MFTNYSYPDEHPDANQIELYARYAAPDDRDWALRVLKNQSKGLTQNTAYELSYSVPLDLAVSKRRDIGAIKGRVFNQLSTEKEGIANVVLAMNGRTAVTDADGRFKFPALSPGNYSLSINRDTIGLTMVTDKTMPMVVNVQTGKDTEVEIGVVNAANLSGTVVLVTPQENGGDNLILGSDGQAYLAGAQTKKQESGGIANILLELSCGDEVMRRATDSHGEFLFESLRPGMWHLKVLDYNIPSYHRIENPEADIELTPGDHNQLTIRVTPKLRPIKILGTEAVTSY
jgi:hypothetical protein